MPSNIKLGLVYEYTFEICRNMFLGQQLQIRQDANLKLCTTDKCKIYLKCYPRMSIPIAARSKAWSAAVPSQGLQVRIPPVHGCLTVVIIGVLSGRGLCV